MDLITGSKTTLGKTKLIETLASIPYRSWELRQYGRMTRGYSDLDVVDEAGKIMKWGREAQDNEFWHLVVINEKMKQDGVKNPWYLFPVIPFFMVTGYSIMTRLMAILNIRRAFLFNAEFEDHAEHVYAEFVAEHPEYEDQEVNSSVVEEYCDAKNWADVFRRIGLDERDHMNSSFAFSGRHEHIVEYEGMPDLTETSEAS